MSTNEHKSGPGIARIWRALFYSLDGLRGAFRTEMAFRQELMLAAFLVPVVFLVPASWTQRAMLLGAVFLVLIIELVNAAVEATVDRISLEHHALAKRAKDIASAAVLLSLLNCAAIWAGVLLDVFVG